MNWTANEEIAHFFTNDVKTLHGSLFSGRMDCGKKDPSRSWRFTDA